MSEESFDRGAARGSSERSTTSFMAPEESVDSIGARGSSNRESVRECRVCKKYFESRDMDKCQECKAPLPMCVDCAETNEYTSEEYDFCEGCGEDAWCSNCITYCEDGRQDCEAICCTHCNNVEDPEIECVGPQCDPSIRCPECDARNECPVCAQNICTTCLEDVELCSDNNCPSSEVCCPECIRHCKGCQKPYCKSCVKKCTSCKENFCADCMKYFDSHSLQFFCKYTCPIEDPAEQKEFNGKSGKSKSKSLKNQKKKTSSKKRQKKSKKKQKKSKKK